MEKKIEKKHIDYGFGFPICLLNVPMIKVRGTWAPDVNYNQLTKEVALALAHREALLTGNQVKFLRQFFEMTLKEFGDRFNVSHPAVIKWENQKNKPTKMNWSTEKDIRMEIVRRIVGTPQEIGSLFMNLEEKPRRASESIDVELNAA